MIFDLTVFSVYRNSGKIPNMLIGACQLVRTRSGLDVEPLSRLPGRRLIALAREGVPGGGVFREIGLRGQAVQLGSSVLLRRWQRTGGPFLVLQDGTLDGTG